MRESPSELQRLQDLLDTSMAAAGPHLRSIVASDRRLDAAALCDRLPGMCLLVVASVTADGRPLTAPVDGYFLNGEFHFSTARQARKVAHLAARPAVSATHLPSEHLCVTVHGTVEPYDVLDPDRPALRQAMLDWYVPRQGPAFEEWLSNADAIAYRIAADRLFAFTVGG